ncbi:hypothetical protein Tco_0895695 [Tanacetum coccineum]|uniref:Uncharacterized protein n=1 Tax=Tanacetum coccineum TaxID=301880 RepID=A0ABQ5CHU0_9ASTR
MGIIPNYLSKYGPEYYMVGCSNMVCLRRGFQPDILMDRGLGTNGLLGLLTSSLTIDLVMSLSNGVSVTPFASDMVDEPQRNADRTFKVAHQNLLTTRTMDDEDAPGLKALLTFKLHDEDAAEGFFGDIVRVCGPQMVLKNVRDIHGLALAIVLERLNSHGAFPEVHDKTRATGSGPTVKTTSKITKSDGYGSNPESIAVSSCGCQEFEATSKDPEGHSVDDLIKEFRSCLSAKVSKTFDISLMGASSKSCEYVLDTLMQVFEDKWFAHAVKERTLDNLITEILIWLLDERVPRIHDGNQLLKVLNVLMLKILDNAERTSSFVVLISLLIPLHPSRWPSPTSNESFATRNMKFSNLVEEQTYRVGARENDVHMLKTLLYELCKLCGTAIKGHLSMVPIDMEPQPIILAYIDLNLQRELAPINNNNNIPNSAGARLTYLLYYKTQAELYLRLQRNISEEEIAGLKQTFEMIDADIGHIT